MTIVNRRNAVVGYLALKGGKMVARRKVKSLGGKLVSRRNGNSAKSTRRSKQSAKT